MPCGEVISFGRALVPVYDPNKDLSNSVNRSPNQPHSTATWIVHLNDVCKRAEYFLDRRSMQPWLAWEQGVGKRDVDTTKIQICS